MFPSLHDAAPLTFHRAAARGLKGLRRGDDHDSERNLSATILDTYFDTAE